MSSHRVPKIVRGLLRLLPALLLSLPQGVTALEDPTRPPVGIPAKGRAATPAAPQLELTSILIAEARRVAVINGRQVGLGDSVGGGRVVAIDASGVTVRRHGRLLHLSLLGLRVKQTAGNE